MPVYRNKREYTFPRTLRPYMQLTGTQTPSLAGRGHARAAEPVCSYSPAGALYTSLVEEAQDLATSVLPASLVVVHDAVRRSQDDVAELARWQQVDDPLLNSVRSHVEARGNDAALVDAANQIDDDLASAVVIDNLKLANVACGCEDEKEGRYVVGQHSASRSFLCKLRSWRCADCLPRSASAAARA